MKKVKFTVSLMLILCFLFSNLNILALDSNDYIYNEYAESVKAPAGYVYGKTVSGYDLGIGDLYKPSDIYIENYIYIADSGNNRIVLLNKDYTYFSEIGTIFVDGKEEKLLNPTGVFKKNDYLYICDTGNARAVAIDTSKNVKRIFKCPDTNLLPKDFEFKPSKIIVNSADSVFIAANGVYQGILQYGSNDSFVGFFGANKVEVTTDVVLQNMWKNIFSSKQREAMIRTVPTEYANLYIDKEDMIYTATKTVSTKQIQKLNSLGNNILVYPDSKGSLINRGYDKKNFGDQGYYEKNSKKSSQICDVHVDENGIIASLDSRCGRVFLFNDEQNQICIFGGSGNQNGSFKNAVAIEKNGEEYLILDSDKNTISVFYATEYMENIISALKEYKKGNYDKSAEYWEKIISCNGALSVAYRGIGRAMLNKGNYKDAIEYLKIGDDRYYYSMAIQQYRREYMRDNFIWLFPLILFICFGFVAVIKYIKKKILQSSNK